MFTSWTIVSRQYTVMRTIKIFDLVAFTATRTAQYASSLVFINKKSKKTKDNRVQTRSNSHDNLLVSIVRNGNPIDYPYHRIIYPSSLALGLNYPLRKLPPSLLAFFSNNPFTIIVLTTGLYKRNARALGLARSMDSLRPLHKL